MQLQGKRESDRLLDRGASLSENPPGLSNLSILPKPPTYDPKPITNMTTMCNPFYKQPLHLRLKLYNQRRKELGIEEIKCFVKKSKSARARMRFNNRRKQRKEIDSTILDKEIDIRPYANIQIFGKDLKGLLDSGATISVLGKGALDLLKESKTPFSKCNSLVKTASGEPQTIIGKLSCPVTYKETTKKITFFIAPTLSQEIYLGVNFWKEFELAPQLFGHVSEISCEPPLENPKMHSLEEAQQNCLSEAIRKFPSSEILGLGQTKLITHTIDTGTADPIKQRHYPYSPAMQNLIYGELDRMLANDVIEESNSDWSSPIVLLRKPGKVRLCLDSRKLNTVTKKLAYPLPHIEGLLSRLNF